MRFRGGPTIRHIRIWGNSWRATMSHAEHARGPALLVRLMILMPVLVAAGCMTYLDGGDRPWQWLLIIGIPGIACAMLPDSHFGLAVVVAITVPWLREIDEVTSPWSLFIGVLLAVFHVSMASASAAPGSAPWTATMARRYVGRVVMASLVAAFTWMLVVGFAEYDAAAGPLIAAALVAVGVGAVWSREGRVRGRP